MDSGVHECGICNEDYNSSDHKPLFLECGHTCCLSCMTHMEKPGGINCPRCRKFTPKQVYQLLVNFDLIPAGDQSSVDISNSTSEARCGNHSFDLDHLCASCGDLVCQHCKIDAHFGHKVESLNSIADSGTGSDVRIEFRDKLQAKLDRFTTFLTGPREALQIIEEVKTNVEEWRDSLLDSQSSVEQDLRLWDALGSCTDQAGAIKDIVHRMKKPELSHDYKKLQIGTKLDELNKKHFAREHSPSEAQQLLPHRGDWRINSNAEVANAFLSVSAGRAPATAIITSWPTDPLQQLPQLLDALGRASKSIDVRLMDFFWQPTLRMDPRLQSFIQNYGRKVGGFLGSPEDSLAVCRARGDVKFVVGVCLADMIDVDSCKALTSTPRSVCCIKGLPAQAGARFKQFNWQPQRWHFPDIHDSDLNWMHSLTKHGMAHTRGSTLLLPRCHLTEEGMRSVLKKYEGRISLLNCAPVSLKNDARDRLAHFAREKGIGLRWKQY